MTKKRIIYAILTLLWSLFIFWLSHQSHHPSFKTSTIDYVIKHLGHVFLYQILFFLSYKTMDFKQKKSYYFAALYSLLFAISDEIHQKYVPNRQPSFIDIIYDSFGIFISFLIIKNIKSNKNK